jgi:hypothetical protein
MGIFQELLNLPKQAIFALVNETDGKVYVSFSTRFPSKLGSIIGQLVDKTWRWKEMILRRKFLKLVILETSVERNFVKYYKEQFQKNGYTVYNEKEKLPLWYEFKINYSLRKVLVVAVNARNDKTVLGRFNTYEEARGFLLYIKHNNPANSLCYSISGLRK